MDKRIRNKFLFLHQRTHSVLIPEFLNRNGETLLVSHALHDSRHDQQIFVIKSKENIDVIGKAWISVQIHGNTSDDEVSQLLLMEFPQNGLIIGHGRMVRRASPCG